MSTIQDQQRQDMSMGYLVDFEKAIENRDAPSILRLWEEYTSAPEDVDAEDFLGILEAVKNSELHEYVGRHIERAIPILEALPSGEKKDRILQLIVDLEMVNSSVLRDLTHNFLEEKFGDDKLFNEKMRLIGLRSKKGNFKGAISHYLLLNHMKKGNFVFHNAGWGVGEIMEVSMIREQLNLEFDYVPGRKDLSFKVAFTTLIPIPESHFLARRFGNPDLLEKEAKKNPVEVIRMLLKDLGPKTAAEIKDELCDLVIPEDEWNRWWQNTRAKIKKDTQIENPTDIKSPFKSLKTEVSHEERLQKALEKKPDADTLIQMVYSFMKDFSEAMKNPEFKNSLINRISELISFEGVTAAQELQIHFFLQDLKGEKKSPQIAELLKNTEALEQIIDEIQIHSFKKRVLAEIEKCREDWTDLFLKFFVIVEQNLLRDFILTKLMKSPKKEELKKLLADLYAHPQQHSELLIWYFQKVLGDSTLPFGNKQGLAESLEAFLTLLSHLEKTGERRDIIKKMHGILSAGRYQIVRDIMKVSSLHDVEEFLLLVSKCHSLSDHDNKIFLSLAEVAHPSIGKKKKQQMEPEDEVIWTTKEGYALLQQKIEQIGTVETVENAKEIEIARAHGDLRENAEFKAALEKRDRLQGELKFLSDQLNKCQIFTKADISTKEVGVGTIVECETTDGKKVSYTFLGPWDADPDKNILSFQSKLAQRLKGLKKGDTFELQGDTYKITEIRSAL